MKIIIAVVLILAFQGCADNSAGKRTNADLFRLAEQRCENNEGLYETKNEDQYALCNNGAIVHLIKTKTELVK